MANRRRLTAATGVGAATAALLMTGLAATAVGSGPGRTSGRGGSAAPAASAVRAGELDMRYLGVFTDSGAEGVRGLAGLSRWLGGTPVRVGHTYLPGGNWEGIEDPRALLRPWADWRRARQDRLFVLNVPMQARNEEHLSDGEVRGLIRRGAGGAFDRHFTRLAGHLVRLGLPDTVVVLGWEMNGTTYSHRCGPDPEDWKAYWRRVVAAMRAVPGQRFRFDFAPSRGTDDVPWTKCYPGDGSVDVIGMDSYDQPSGEPFSRQVGEPYGLQAQVDFAARHGKAVSYPEWGLFRNGDDPDYVARMLRWMSDHHALYQTVTDYCPHGVWQCEQNPRSSKVFRTLLSGIGTASHHAPAKAAPGKAPAPKKKPAPSGSRSPSRSPKPAGRPSAHPAGKPAAAPSRKQAAKPAARPNAAPARKPAATSAEKPAAKSKAAPARKPNAASARKPAAKSHAAPARKAAARSAGGTARIATPSHGAKHEARRSAPAAPGAAPVPKPAAKGGGHVP